MSNQVVDSTNDNTNAETDPSGIPNLDQIINQITSNGDFKEMMNNVSEGLQMPLKEVSIPEKNTTESDQNNKTSESLYDLCCTFLSDSDGNSLADILHEVNTNLSNISKNLEKIANKSS